MNLNDSVHPAVSFVISTYKRRDVLFHTLRQLQNCGLDRGKFEILVVDNNSPDYTAKGIGENFPDVRAFALMSNRGSCAKNVAIGHARGQIVVFLDDDSYPQPGSIVRMLEHFAMNPRLGAAVFTITLPDGSRECSAYPDVFIGCGTGFRREALNEVGYLPADFFMQAEEYDLSLRLLQAGWDIRTFDDVHVAHLKTPNARRSWRTMRLDVRNNFIVATRYLPKPWRSSFTFDWMMRYRRIAAAKQQPSAFWIGLSQGIVRAVIGKRRTVSEAVFERFSRTAQIEQAMASAMQEQEIRSILLVDYGKNIYPYWLAAQKLGLKVVAVADSKLAGCRYRGISVINDSIARRLDFDVAVISNSSPVHALARAQAWRKLDSRPVLELLPFSQSPQTKGLAA